MIILLKGKQKEISIFTGKIKGNHTFLKGKWKEIIIV